MFGGEFKEARMTLRPCGIASGMYRLRRLKAKVPRKFWVFCGTCLLPCIG